MVPEFSIACPLWPVLFNLTDEAITSTMCGFNEARRLWIIAQSLTDLTNGNFEDGIAHKGFWPDGLEKIFLGDELARTSE